MAAKAIKIGTDEHVYVMGMTGSGKTVLCEVYLSEYKNVIKLDTKGEVYERRAKGKSAWYGLEEGEDFQVVETLAELMNCGSGKIIYAPTFEEQTPDVYDEFFKFCYLRENTVVWVDELMSIATASRYPQWLRAIMTRGRSKHVAAWCCTQRPVDVPTIVPANTTHFFCFDLMLETDRKKVCDITGWDTFMERPGKYNFWYFKVGQDHPPVKARLKL